MVTKLEGGQLGWGVQQGSMEKLAAGAVIGEGEMVTEDRKTPVGKEP